MGYVEEIEKINKLAKEMMRHGMAKSLDEAVFLSQEALRKEGSMTIDVTDIKRRISEREEKEKTQAAIDTAKNNICAPIIDWQEAMSKNTQYIVGQLAEFQKIISNLNSELQCVKSELASVKQAQAKFNFSSSAKEQVINIEDDARPEPRQQSAPQSQHSAPRSQSSDAASQRYGNYKPEDVDVSKVFYFGNKK